MNRLKIARAAVLQKGKASLIRKLSIIRLFSQYIGLDVPFQVVRWRD